MKLFSIRFREKITLKKMIRLYCKKHHGKHKALCPECQELLNYALVRLDKCPFEEKKSICRECEVHCYKKNMREKVRAVMRYSGPRLLFRNPILALLHLWDSRRKSPKND